MKDRSKANPNTFKDIIEFLNINPEECVIVEDGILSIRAAKIIGIQTIYMQNNFYVIEDSYQNYKNYVDKRFFNFLKLN
ncbi:MAG: HAD hydrolase-like protein [Leptospiraceae bacterium]|nr:HAD hydrolase-like protein [Leptospiraceae bacterium]